MAVVVDTEEQTWTGGQRPVVAIAILAGMVARWWALGAPGLTFDEAFTAAYARLPLSEIPTALRHDDAHPPLDYVLRHWLAGAHSEWALRAPSAVFASISLVLFAWWMRRRGWFGVAAVALLALSPFQLLYGREARMYALMCLVGLGVAILADRRLRGKRSVYDTVAVGLLVALACLDHAGGLFLAAGVMVVPLLERDRSAWMWRGATATGVVVWATLWGPSFAVQAGRTSTSWVPLTRPASLAAAVGGLGSFLEGAEWAVAAMLVLGCVCAWTFDRALGRLLACLFGVPLVLLAVVGLRAHVVLSRTLAPSAWVAPVAFAALITWCWARRVALGAGAAVLVAAFTLRSLPRAVAFDEGSSRAVAAGIAHAAPGDGVLVHPSWWWPLAAWNGASGGEVGEPPPTSLEGAGGWYWERPGNEATGLTWVLRPSSYALDTSRWPSCGPTERLGDGWLLDCVVTGGS